LSAYHRAFTAVEAIYCTADLTMTLKLTLVQHTDVDHWHWHSLSNFRSLSSPLAGIFYHLCRISKCLQQCLLQFKLLFTSKWDAHYPNPTKCVHLRALDPRGSCDTYRTDTWCSCHRRHGFRPRRSEAVWTMSSKNCPVKGDHLPVEDRRDLLCRCSLDRGHPVMTEATGI